MKLIELPWLLLLLLLLSISTASATCPIDFSYVLRIPWNSSSCQSYQPAPPSSPNGSAAATPPCCQSLLSVFGIGLAHHLKETSDFHLPDVPTSDSCLRAFQTQLGSLSLPDDLAGSCFDPAQFTLPSRSCAGVESLRSWVSVLGPSTALDAACRRDLSDLTLCDACSGAGQQVQNQLVAIDGNSSHARACFYFAILYAAGVVNELGPESHGVMSCVFQLALNAPKRPSNKAHTALVFGVIGACVAFLVMLCLLGLYFWYARKWKRMRIERHGFGVDEHESRPRLRPNATIWFKIDELEKATNDFSQKNFIGRGGFGLVYKGVLADGTMVAVKRIVESDFQNDVDFCNEVEIISNLKHRSLVPLRGCCVVDGDESHRYLVYDYMPNGNLDDRLFLSVNNRNMVALTWPQRKSIIFDVAKGLAYLHYGVKPAIYHRDIKAANILLDFEMRARVADFGLVKQSREGQSHLTTRVAGTHGYLAPEYALYGQLTEKSNVYSFGVVVLEILCCRKALDLSASSMQAILITDWAWALVRAGKWEEALDVSLFRDAEFPSASSKVIMERFLLVGILCAHVMVALRPTITDALKMLEGDVDVPSIPDRPMPLGHPSLYEGGSSFSIPPMLSRPSLPSSG